MVATKANNMSSISYKYFFGPSNGCIGCGSGLGKGVAVDEATVVVGGSVCTVILLSGTLTQLSTVQEQKTALGSSTLMVLNINAKARVACKTKSYTLQNLTKVFIDLAFRREFKSAHNMEIT